MAEEGTTKSVDAECLGNQGTMKPMEAPQESIISSESLGNNQIIITIRLSHGISPIGWDCGWKRDGWESLQRTSTQNEMVMQRLNAALGPTAATIGGKCLVVNSQLITRQRVFV